jgi:translation initiation factor 1
MTPGSKPRSKALSIDKTSDRAVYQEFNTASSASAFERPATPDLPPAQQTLTIQVSRKGRGGKTVTVISGFQQSPSSLQTLTKKLKSHCGSGGTLKEQTVEIQGDHRLKAKQWLEDLGYRTKLSGG